MKTILSITLFAILFSLGACTREKSDCDSPNLITSLIEGNWIPDYKPNEYRFAGEVYSFTFSTDSFYLKRYRWTDVVYSPECNKFEWHNYVAGTYTLNANTMSLTGSFLDSNFVLPTDSGECDYHEWGSYYLKANVELCNDQIVADPVQGNSYYTIPIKIKRK